MPGPTYHAHALSQLSLCVCGSAVGVGGGMSIQVLGSNLVTGASVSLSNITSSSNNVTSSPSDGGGAGVHILVSSTRNIANTSVAVQDAHCDSNVQVDGQ
jgi:hypothetical protein